eukprot:1159857-Pelagomonas_calceolata.AAC.4
MATPVGAAERHSRMTQQDGTAGRQKRMAQQAARSSTEATAWGLTLPETGECGDTQETMKCTGNGSDARLLPHILISC